MTTRRVDREHRGSGQCDLFGARSQCSGAADFGSGPALIARRVGERCAGNPCSRLIQVDHTDPIEQGQGSQSVRCAQQVAGQWAVTFAQLLSLAGSLELARDQGFGAIELAVTKP